MTPIRSVIFDVAGVIADWAPDRPLRGKLSDADIAAFLDSEAYWRINAEMDAGMRISELFDRVDAELPALAPAVRTYVERFPLSVSGPVPGTTEIIDELLAAGVPCYGLSNWWSENFAVPRAAAPVIDRLADVIVSGDVGLAKPDEAIFTLALDRFGLDAASTLFVDDVLANVQAAERVGLRGHHFTGAEGLRDDLVALGLL